MWRQRRSKVHARILGGFSPTACLFSLPNSATSPARKCSASFLSRMLVMMLAYISCWTVSESRFQASSENGSVLPILKKTLLRFQPSEVWRVLSVPRNSAWLVRNLLQNFSNDFRDFWAVSNFHATSKIKSKKWRKSEMAQFHAFPSVDFKK